LREPFDEHGWRFGRKREPSWQAASLLNEGTCLPRLGYHGMAPTEENAVTEQKSKKPEDNGPAGGNYNPGGQASKSAQEQEGRQQSPNNTNPGQTGTPGGKGKQDGPQNQKR
jgi:hypothetical protein